MHLRGEIMRVRVFFPVTHNCSNTCRSNILILKIDAGEMPCGIKYKLQVFTEVLPPDRCFGSLIQLDSFISLHTKASCSQKLFTEVEVNIHRFHT